MNITDLDKCKSKDELKEFAEKLLDTLLSLQEELQRTKDKLSHLDSIKSLSVGSNEEELCKLEINRLYQASKSAPLEFQEVKSFEIYVKSLMLIRGKSIEEKKKRSEPELSTDQLLSLALQVADESNEQ